MIFILIHDINQLISALEISLTMKFTDAFINVPQPLLVSGPVYTNDWCIRKFTDHGTGKSVSDASQVVFVYKSLCRSNTVFMIRMLTSRLVKRIVRCFKNT